MGKKKWHSMQKRVQTYTFFFLDLLETKPERNYQLARKKKESAGSD